LEGILTQRTGIFDEFIPVLLVLCNERWEEDKMGKVGEAANRRNSGLAKIPQRMSTTLKN
jgi:hypothetical protein